MSHNDGSLDLQTLCRLRAAIHKRNLTHPCARWRAPTPVFSFNELLRGTATTRSGTGRRGEGSASGAALQTVRTKRQRQLATLSSENFSTGRRTRNTLRRACSGRFRTSRLPTHTHTDTQTRTREPVVVAAASTASAKRWHSSLHRAALHLSASVLMFSCEFVQVNSVPTFLRVNECFFRSAEQEIGLTMQYTVWIVAESSI